MLRLNRASQRYAGQEATHGTARRWALEFNAVGVKAKCLNRLIGPIDGRTCSPIIVILISLLFPNS